MFVEDISSNYASDHGIYLKGFAEKPLDSISISNVNIIEAEVPVELINVDYLILDKIIINGTDYSNIE